MAGQIRQLRDAAVAGSQPVFGGSVEVQHATGAVHRDDWLTSYLHERFRRSREALFARATDRKAECASQMRQDRVEPAQLIAVDDVPARQDEDRLTFGIIKQGCA